MRSRKYGLYFTLRDNDDEAHFIGEYLDIRELLDDVHKLVQSPSSRAIDQIIIEVEDVEDATPVAEKKEEVKIVA